MHTVRSHIVRSLMGLGLLLIVGLASVTPIYAGVATKGTVSPHTMVSNDGYIPVQATGTGRIGAMVSQGYVGTGIPLSGLATFALDNPAAAVIPPGDGGAETDSVIGADGRFQITATTTYPYRAIAHISSSIGGCTGWLINANTVVTAGHCVYNGGWATSVVVYPGRSGSSTPYGSCTSLRLFSVSGWTSSGNRDFDYGAIKLNCSIGNTTGFFGYRVDSSSMVGQPTFTAGYPGDKPYPTMWRSDDQVRQTTTRRVYYANDTFGGQSGSAVWNDNAGCNTCSIAIHAYGVDSTGFNGGTRITTDVYNNLTTWKNS